MPSQLLKGDILLKLLFIGVVIFLFTAAAGMAESWWSATQPYRGWLAKVRYCESGGNYRAVSSNGMYSGAYQFDDQTWRSVGGRGRASWASPLEQDYRAVLLYRRRGSAPWPVCG